MPSATLSETPQRISASKQSVTPKKALLLKGYIRSTGNGQFEGVCLNLNLVVRGRTLEDTDKKLFELIVAYLKDAEKDGTFDDLVPRRAPLAYYMEYYRLKTLSQFRSLVDFKLFVRTAPPCSAHA